MEDILSEMALLANIPSGSQNFPSHHRPISMVFGVVSLLKSLVTNPANKRVVPRSLLLCLAQLQESLRMPLSTRRIDTTSILIPLIRIVKPIDSSANRLITPLKWQTHFMPLSAYTVAATSINFALAAFPTVKSMACGMMETLRRLPV